MGIKRKFFEEPQFIELQKQWYEKLKEKKFTDIEIKPDARTMPVSPLQFNQIDHKLKFELQLNYFLFIGQCVELENFASRRDKIIMYLRAEGCRIKEILAVLRAQGYFCHRQTVRFVIRRFENKWKIRAWDPQQMTSRLLTR